MALHAIHGDAVQHLPSGGCAIHHRGKAEFLVIGAAFIIGRGLAMEGRGDPVFEIGAGKQIARQLLDHELVIGQVAC